MNYKTKNNMTETLTPFEQVQEKFFAMTPEQRETEKMRRNEILGSLAYADTSDKQTEATETMSASLEDWQKQQEKADNLALDEIRNGLESI